MPRTAAPLVALCLRLRLLLLLLLVLPLTLGGSALARPAAQEPATPTAGALRTPLDLAALTLTPADLAAEGLPGYGLAAGRRYSRDELARTAAEARAGGPTSPTSADFSQRLADAGWLASYESTLAIVDESSPDLLRHSVESFVDHYGTAAGAADAFALTTDEREFTTVEVRQIRGTGAVADESRYWRFRGEAIDTGNPFAGLSLSFRLDNLVAGVQIYDWRGGSPDVATVDALAARLLDRLEAAPTPPGVAAAALDLDGVAVVDAYSNYLRRDGESFPYAGGTVEQALAGFPDAPEIYVVRQTVATGDPGTADDARLAVWLFRFADERAAAAWLDQERRDAGDSAAAYPVADGAEAFTYSYVLPAAAGGAPSQGFVSLVQSGDRGFILEVGATPNVQLGSYDRVAIAQLACLVDAACPPLPLPPALVSIPSVPAATPTP